MLSSLCHKGPQPLRTDAWRGRGRHEWRVVRCDVVHTSNDTALCYVCRRTIHLNGERNMLHAAC